MEVIYTLASVLLVLYIWARCQKSTKRYEKGITDLIEDDNFL